MEEKKQNWFRQHLFLIFLSILLITSIGSTFERNKKNPSTQTSNLNQPTPISSIPLTTVEKLSQIADQIKRLDKSKVKVEFGDDNIASLVYTNDNFWNGRSLVKETVRTFVDFGKEAVKFPDVQRVVVIYKTKFIDKYGKENIGVGASIAMPKSEFVKFNWDNLSGMPVYDRIHDAPDTFFSIHGSIRGEINLEDITL